MWTRRAALAMGRVASGTLTVRSAHGWSAEEGSDGPLIEAKELLSRDPVFLDTETTGLEAWDEICEVAVLAADGAVLLDTLVQPTRPVSFGAQSVHGISDMILAGAPTFAKVWPALRAALAGRTVVTYNAAFDLRLLTQSAVQARLEMAWPPGQEPVWVCAMKLFAKHNGEWDARSGDWRWIRLETAARRCGLEIPVPLHRARADAELTRRIVEHLARIDVPGI